jgi:hypothetical protein
MIFKPKQMLLEFILNIDRIPTLSPANIPKVAASQDTLKQQG